jgi:hypothetical protein
MIRTLDRLIISGQLSPHTQRQNTWVPDNDENFLLGSTLSTIRENEVLSARRCDPIIRTRCPNISKVGSRRSSYIWERHEEKCINIESLSLILLQYTLIPPWL